MFLWGLFFFILSCIFKWNSDKMIEAWTAPLNKAVQSHLFGMAVVSWKKLRLTKTNEEDPRLPTTPPPHTHTLVAFSHLFSDFLAI